MPASGSDFVTAPELTPLFGHTLARQVAQALRRRAGRRGLGVRRRLGRAGGAVAGRPGRACAALLDRRPVRHACASGRPSGWRPSARRVRWLDACPRRCTAWWSATRCSTRCRCSCCTGTASSGSSAAWRCTATRLRLGRPRHRRCARRCAGPFVPGTVTEIHPQAEAFIAHAGRAPAARRRLLHRLRLPRGRVLPPAAQRRHADVPPRPPRRHRPAGRRGRQGHHGACRLQRHRAGGAGRRAGRARLHLAGALPAQLRPARPAAGRRPAAPRPRRRSCSPSTRWASCSRSSAWPAAFDFDAIGFSAGDRSHTL